MKNNVIIFLFVSLTECFISVQASGNMPRLEPFASGQVYNHTRTARVHVLPAPNAHNPSLGPNSFGSNPGLQEQKSNQQQQHVSLPFYWVFFFFTL